MGIPPCSGVKCRAWGNFCSFYNGNLVSFVISEESKLPVKYVFSATSSTSIFVPKNETYDDTRRSCRNYYVLQGTQSDL